MNIIFSRFFTGSSIKDGNGYKLILDIRQKAVESVR